MCGIPCRDDRALTLAAVLASRRVKYSQQKAKEAFTENVVRRFQGASKRANDDQVKSGEGAAARGSVREVLLELSRLVDAFFG